MRHYELVLIFSPTLNQEQTVASWARVKEFIHNRNGEVTHEERWGTRRLAYPIHKSGQHFLEGAYYLTRFSTERPFLRELESFLHVDEQILRSLVVATAPPQPAPVSAEPVAAVASTSPEGVVETVAEPAAPEVAAPTEDTVETAVEPPAEVAPARPRTRQRRVAQPVAGEPAAPAEESAAETAPAPPRTRRRRVAQPVSEEPAAPAEASAAEGPQPDQPSA